MPWGDRQVLLEIMFDNIQYRSKILLNKNIIDIEHALHGVRLKCEDKSSYEGDILAGADGVASKMRDQMWRLADAAEPGLVSKDKDCKCFVRSLHLSYATKSRRSVASVLLTVADPAPNRYVS
jgi:2-polyprenyl-6-methoxyphenol hydroxylase-like FAD-dependent oxidoreductase